MADIRSQLKELALPCPAGDRVKSAIGRAAKESGLSYERTRKIWYGEAHRIEAAEIELVRVAHIKKEIREFRKHVAHVQNYISRQEALLRTTDEDFHSENLAALGSLHLRA